MDSTGPTRPRTPLTPVAIWRQLVDTYRRVSSMRWLFLGFVAGIVSGLGAVLFYTAVEGLTHLFLVQWAGFPIPAPTGEHLFHGAPGPYRPWIVPLLTTTVGLATGFIVSRLMPETTDSGTDGTDAMIKAFHHHSGLIRPLVPVLKAATAVLTIAAGGSAGREGPISQLGAGIGSWLAQRLGLSARERRILLLAGAAGGLGAIFRAPLGGALTAVEVVYREDFEAEAVLPSVLSSVTAYSLFTLFFGAQPIFSIPQFHFRSALELPFYVVLAGACSAMGWAYLKTFFFFKHRLFGRLRSTAGLTLTMGLGGLLTGLLGWAFPALLSGGYGWLELALLGQLPALAMLGMVIGKTIGVSLTIGSGMSGGMFAPALLVGGMTGGVVGRAANALFPAVVTEPGGFILVGMAAFFAGVANAAIGPLVMVCELTQGYGLLAPLMLTSALCLVLNRNISLYENQVENKFESPAHAEDATINVLENLLVRDHYRRERTVIIEENVTLAGLTDIIANSNAFAFPVKNAEGRLTGMLALQDVRRFLYEDSLFDLLVAKDLARPAATLLPDDDLYKALLLFVDTDFSQIPVVSPDDPDHILGLLHREDVFQAYSLAIRSIREAGAPAMEPAA